MPASITHQRLSCFHPTLSRWFLDAFEQPTPVQAMAWPLIAAGKSTLLLAPTGSGKTLAAFLVAVDRIMFREQIDRESVDRNAGVRTLYISPLKALGVDVERNLRSPIAGVRVAALRDGTPHHVPSVGVRSGDTPSAERTRITRDPPDILITTPESLYLMLTSRARNILGTIDTVIVDEIHSLVGTKRGAHLFLSLERLEQFRREINPHVKPLQRIGLSATQRPLDEVARLLGGTEATGDLERPPQPRPVQIVEAGRRRQLELTIEVPVEDMAQMGVAMPQSGATAAGPALPSIWPAIHPRLVELIRAHRSTMLFVNSRRLAERLAASINEAADEEIALAHHGSIAKETRLRIEDRLKRGQLAAIVATSSLELGIDMGAVDLVIQVEAPPSIAAGIQRIGRAGHQVGATSEGIIFPKFRGDLLACSAATERMKAGEVEETFYPRNPLDVLAQQIVAMVALEAKPVSAIFATVRGAAPFSDLPRSAFEGVLDLLSGRYPSDEFSGLRPRLTWDRIKGEVAPRKGTQRVAILNAGTIPDRGLYGVFLASEAGGGSRVGELDEEMVFEIRPGDVFLLGASSWRVIDITHDRVLVTPAPGEPGRMPFWRGDGPGRPLEFGRAIGELTRRLLRLPRATAEAELAEKHALDVRAARNLMDYLLDQREATGEVPNDKTILVESFLDEVGDWRVAILSPFGSRVHAPWAMAVMGRLRERLPDEVDMTWTDDGIMFRMPSSDDPPSLEMLLPSSDSVEEIIVHELGGTALFAARFRENAARALLLPRQTPGKRTPLWVQRRRSADLLKVAAQYRDFPILLETYRECLRDVFDLRGLVAILQAVEHRAIQVKSVETRTASPFASSLMFNYTANFLYDGDAPLAERKARSLALDYTQLRELLGEAELRELLDADAVDELSLQLQRLDGKYPLQHLDGLHELLLKLGDLTRAELLPRVARELAHQLDDWLEALQSDRRIVALRIAGELRYAAAEDAARFRDALGVVPPPGLPDAFVETVDDPLGDLVSRYARTHAPFRIADIVARFGIGAGIVRQTLARLAAQGRVLEGEFLPGGQGREWCDAEVLRVLKRRSLARLRQQIEPVSTAALGAFLPQWQSIANPRRGLDGLLDVIEQLQGAVLPASALEQAILPARVSGYAASDLDELCAAGEVVWRGFEALGPGDGWISLYLADHYSVLAKHVEPAAGELQHQIRQLLAQRGALFFDDLFHVIGGFRNDVLTALWDLVWSGEVSNDTLAPLRALRRDNMDRQRRRSRRRTRTFRSRRVATTPGSEGRWSLLWLPEKAAASSTEKQAALAKQLLERYGVLTREMVASERVVGGFSGLYPVLKAMEEAGSVRRGYFVAGLGAAQFAAPGAEDRLREADRSRGEGNGSETAESTWMLAATDPANPYGSALSWPERAGARPRRVAGARVILHRGELLGYLGPNGQSLLSFLPAGEPALSQCTAALLSALDKLTDHGEVVYLSTVDGVHPGESSLASALAGAGFVPSAKGYQLRAKPQL